MDTSEKKEYFRIVMRKILWKLTLVLILCELGFTLLAGKASAADVKYEAPKKLAKLIQAQAKAAVLQGKNASFESIRGATVEESKAYSSVLKKDLKALTKSKNEKEKLESVSISEALTQEMKASKKTTSAKKDASPRAPSAASEAMPQSGDDFVSISPSKASAPAAKAEPKPSSAISVLIDAPAGPANVDFRQDSGSSVNFGGAKTSE